MKIRPIFGLGGPLFDVFRGPGAAAPFDPIKAITAAKQKKCRKVSFPRTQQNDMNRQACPWDIFFCPIPSHPTANYAYPILSHPIPSHGIPIGIQFNKNN